MLFSFLPTTIPCGVKVTTLVVVSAALIHQLYVSLFLIPFYSEHAQSPPSTQGRFGDMAIPPPQPSSFGACLMIKEDNDLLYEWIAYHYTVLPLRYLIVGSDVNNTQDPSLVLNRWSESNENHATDLAFWTLQPEDFLERHGPLPVIKRGEDDEHDFHHHGLVHRQKAFFTTCTERLAKLGVHRTVYVDTDEYVALNRWGPEDEALLTVDGPGHYTVSNASYHVRTAFPPVDSDLTVAQALEEHDFCPCLTMPRLIVGAAENRSCLESANYLENQTHSALSTLRFVQTAKKGDFSTSKFGKVSLDLSRISAETIERVPTSIHRPWRDICGHAVAHFYDAPLFIYHYIGSWERYSGRLDGRRNRDEWEQRAFFDDGLACGAGNVAYWFPRFIDLVGHERAMFLLGADNSTTSL